MIKTKKTPKPPTSELAGLRSIGPAMLRDFELLGIHHLSQLANSNPENLYQKLCRLTGQRQDPCVLDTFCCAAAQAKNPRLPSAQKNWWYWSRIRKAKIKKLKARP